MALKYRNNKIMSNFINLDIGIDGDQIALERSSINFRNFRNMLEDGVVQLDDTSLSFSDVSQELAMNLFNALIAIYESQENIDKLSIDSKLQSEAIVKE